MAHEPSAAGLMCAGLAAKSVIKCIPNSRCRARAYDPFVRAFKILIVLAGYRLFILNKLKSMPFWCRDKVAQCGAFTSVDTLKFGEIL